MAPLFQCDVCHYSRPVPEDYAGQKVRCPQCAAVILIQQNGAAVPAAEPAVEQARKSCPFCAELIQWEARKCRFCGEVIDRSLAIAKEQERIRGIERDQQIFQKYLPGARASIITGFLSILLAPLEVGSFLSPVAIILGVQAIRDHKRRPHLEGKAFAWAGVILGAVGILCFALWLLLVKPLLAAQRP